MLTAKTVTNQFQVTGDRATVITAEAAADLFEIHPGDQVDCPTFRTDELIVVTVLRFVSHVRTGKVVMARGEAAT